MKLFLNSKRCIACGLCVQQHPELFELDDQGIAHFKKNLENSSLELDSQEIKKLKPVINNCPGRAFKIERS
ncbi:ferredoxin [Xylocopilactobacillus apicola]|uniref:4Fe-4S ferredoxin-type domain-containing protein n=1 Tax=Xylocopilactobacillus apicola TaxID=2932184 RepID=A0AAU9D598_9LACO|nr:ferredoxin [Xylocopilactobacillus apicola]BDR58663.1 hypothetical protein XA3_11040 [Xylocopilactobacillus apicola]